ncbi:MAG TPA: SusC/RagA family TonB-linked outer membrane protein, partial [Pricia sp.]|nr:SusC/RagA family TonB-linked outer membrane protein [Pricia sp.]
MKKKLSMILFCLLAIATYGNPEYVQRTKISLDFKNATLQEVIDEIESKTEFRFFFSTKVVDTSRKVSIAVKSKPINRILPLLFQEENISYEIYDRKILLKKNDIKKTDESSNTLSVETVQLSVNGKVTDSEGLP